MPKRIKDKNKSIFVRFRENVNDQEINLVLTEMGVSGTRVSNLVNRWAIEVPFWKEDIFIKRFSKNELVDLVHETFDRRRSNTTNQEEIGDSE